MLFRVFWFGTVYGRLIAIVDDLTLFTIINKDKIIGPLSNSQGIKNIREASAVADQRWCTCIGTRARYTCYIYQNHACYQ